MCSTFRFTAQWSRKKCINSIPYQKYIHSFHQEKNLTDPLTLQQQWHIGRERKKSRFLFKIYSSTIKRKKKIKFHENVYSSTMVEYWQKAKERHDLSSSYSSNFFDWKLVKRGVYVNCRWTSSDSMAWIENSFKRVYKYKCI